MRARIGDLVIVRFDAKWTPNKDDPQSNIAGRCGNKWDEQVGIVIEIYDISGRPREHRFMYWYKDGRKLVVDTRDLPSNRLIRARPTKAWDGELKSLTRSDVEPV